MQNPKRVPMRSVARKLDPWKVKAMRAMHKAGVKCSVIATLHGVSDPTAWKVCARRTWRHVG